MFVPAAFGATVILPAMLIYQVSTGVGVWGNNHPVAWGWDIINFVWWVGVAHAGTLISAMLFLTRQHWRTTIGRMRGGDDGFLRDDGGSLSGHSRRARVVCLVHVSDSELERHLAAVPLAADVGRVRRQHLHAGLDAVLVHGNDSRPRRAARPRDDAGAEIHLRFPGDGLDRFGAALAHYEKAYVVLSGLCTLLVFTVSSIVGLDFCTSQLAGWHATIFPLYFVVGAVFAASAWCWCC
jgi:hypothetical protein